MKDTTSIIRNYRPDDFNSYLRLRMESERSDRSGRYLTPRVLAESLNSRNCSPEKDLFLAEANEKIVGFCNITPELGIGRVLFDFLIHPEHRREGKATRLLQHALNRAQKYGAKVAQVDIPETNLSARRLLSSLGFKSVRLYLELRLELQNLSWPDVDPPFISRNMRSGEESKLTEIQNRFFAGSWGFNPNTTEEILHRVNISGCSPEDVILFFDEDDPIGYCWTVVNSEENLALGINRGRIHMMGVDSNYRGKGLGKAVLLAGLAHLRGKAIELVELTVDSQNKAACCLYKSIGFETRSTTMWYEKVLG